MTLGQTLKALRKQRGLTQAQLAARCGLSGAAIGRYEKDAAMPRRSALERLAQALDVPADRLTAQPSAPQPEGVPLYDGVLAALRELYGAVEGRVILGENGASKRYYVVQGVPDSFVLYEQDIAAIARSARASMSPLVERLGGV